MRKRYVTAAVLLVLFIAGIWFYLQSKQGSDTVHIRRDITFSAALREFNTVVLRLHYPFTDMRGPGAAITYATQVFVFNNKEVILQIVEGNKCTRTLHPSTEDNNIPTISTLECMAESQHYPTIEIRQATKNSILQEPLITFISGRPEHIPVMVRYVILGAYPDADKVIAYTRRALSSVG